MAVEHKKLLEFGNGFRLDTAGKVLRHRGEVVSLPLKSIELLAVLVENQGEVVSKIKLMELVWGGAFVEESVLTQNVYLLRKTLQERGGDRELIKTVSRRGYIFTGYVRPVYESNGATEFVIERHLLEKIKVEETDCQTEQRNKVVLPEIAASQRLHFSSILFVAAAILLLAITAAYFYFRSNSTQSKVERSGAVLPVAPLNSEKLKTLAVLPFKIADEREQSFAETFTSDLTVRLASLNKFAVKPFQIVLEHKKRSAELKTNFVLGGEIAIEKNDFSIRANLVDLKTGSEIWQKKFSDADVVRLQNTVANEAANAVLDQLSPPARERLAQRLPTNIAAYETYLNGFLLWRKRADGALPYFKRAIELDANLAGAYVGAASVKMMGRVRDSPNALEAEALAKKALEIEPDSADAFAALGFMQIFHQRDWANAERYLKTAIELDSNNVNAHHWLAVFYSIHRRLDEAKTEMQKALEIDPTNPTLHGDLCQIHYFANEKNAAIESCRQALAFEPNHFFAVQYLSLINNPPEAQDKETILKQLNAAAEQNSFMLLYINVDPQYERVRNEPLFHEIRRRFNL